MNSIHNSSESIVHVPVLFSNSSSLNMAGHTDIPSPFAEVAARCINVTRLGRLEAVTESLAVSIVISSCCLMTYLCRSFNEDGHAVEARIQPPWISSVTENNIMPNSSTDNSQRSIRRCRRVWSAFGCGQSSLISNSPSLHSLRCKLYSLFHASLVEAFHSSALADTGSEANSVPIKHGMPVLKLTTLSNRYVVNRVRRLEEATIHDSQSGRVPSISARHDVPVLTTSPASSCSLIITSWVMKTLPNLG